MKISLIIPLFDRRNSGSRPLESALSQKGDRSQYEVIVVIGRAEGDAPTIDAHTEALLRQCDAVVHVDADPRQPDQEIPFLMAGYARSTGDVLFFMEGHTEPDLDCCAMIAAYFHDNPGSRIAWAPRIYRSESPLGLLIGIHGKQHERRAREHGGFWLGANSVITRELFEQLGRLDADYMRFCERVFSERVMRENIPIGKLDLPLAIHYDDMSLPQLMGVASAAGEAKHRYYNFPAPDAGPVRTRHGIYRVANHAVSALILFPVACLLRGFFLRAAIRLCATNRGWAYRFYVLGLGFADLSGFCLARVRAARASQPQLLPSSKAARR